MKTQFTPIAMRCTKEQFKAIEPKLKKHGLKAKDLSSFNAMPYLINNRLGKVNNITNYSARIDWKKTEGIKKVYETWDEATFLKACGIEVDTYTVSKDFILEAHESACSTWKTKIENQFPELFPKADLTKDIWYYSETKYGNFKNLFRSNDSIDFYGFTNGDWLEGYQFDESSDKTLNNLRLATKEEVETALIDEAKRRGFKEGVVCLVGDAKRKTKLSKSNFELERNMLCVGADIIFNNGKWAEIISKPIKLSLDEIAEKFGVDVSLIKIKK